MENLAAHDFERGMVLVEYGLLATNQNRNGALCCFVHTTRHGRFKRFDAMFSGNLCHGFDFFFAIGRVQDWLVDDAPSQQTILEEDEESSFRHQALMRALDVLNDRERRIFEARRLAEEPITLEDLSEEFGVSRERVRQIEVRAFEKVQKAVQDHMAARDDHHAAPLALPVA